MSVRACEDITRLFHSLSISSSCLYQRWVLPLSTQYANNTNRSAPHPDTLCPCACVLMPTSLFSPTADKSDGQKKTRTHTTQIGLGFAAGAMFWVACFELFLEAVEDSSKLQAGLTTAASFAVMLCMHTYFDHEL